MSIKKLPVSKFEVGDTLKATYKGVEYTYKLVEMPTRCPVLGVKETRGCVLVLECNGCDTHKDVRTHRFGLFDSASVHFNNLYFKKV